MLRYLGRSPETLTAREKSVLKRLAERQTIAQDINQSFDEKRTTGQRLADKVAEFGGSWTFIIVFGVILAAWVVFNSLLATRAFDPYPYIFLNLVLSMLAAVQAPIIMMSQNRQAAKDRLDASHDYEVNLKAEIEIMALHEKFDQLRSNELRGLIEKQQQQIEILSGILLEKNQKQS
ncbi:putative membrane protein [Ochrobactrum sp. P6BSIII]|nr:putative membrane protein [Ochrobactrum sp. P6BSIII]